MKKIVALLVSVFVLSLAIPVIAQDSSVECGADQLTAATEAIDAVNTTAKEAVISGDLTSALEQLTSLSGQLASLEAECLGLSFSGESQKIIGPLQIPEGLYKATLTSDGQGVVAVRATEGKCGQGTGVLLPGLFFYNKGDATNGIEVLFTSEGCTTLIEMTTKATWSIIFEKIT